MQAQNTTQQPPTVFIARQPIFDASGSLWGHELLFRDSPSGPARIDDPDAATASVIADGYAIASETIPGVTPFLINFPEGLLLSGAAEVLPPDRCIPEILETVQPTPELVEALRTLKRAGYRLAVDDFVGQDQALPLLGLADIIKVDVLAVPQTELHALTASLRKRHHAQLLAEKVENAAMFGLCRMLGYTLFQGYHFARPVIVPGRTLSSAQTARLHLMQSLTGEADPHTLVRAVTVDPGLTYRLLRYINSAWFALLKEVTSVQQAASLLGFDTLRKWLLVITLADTAGSAAPAEAMRSAVTRARFLELLCGVTRSCSHAPESMFLLGLLSQLDALLGIAMPHLLAHLPLDADFRAALSGEASAMSDELRLAVLLERGAWDEAMPLMAKLGFSPMDVARSHVDAQVWASRILS
ncbi:EAL domain protein [Desulfovibrio sp. A2]|nr:EAL domain protein [Desulfovibrio sp. A2]